MIHLRSDPAMLCFASATIPSLIHSRARSISWCAKYRISAEVKGLQKKLIPSCHALSPTMAIRSMSPQCLKSSLMSSHKRGDIPSVEVVHLEQYADLSVLPDQLLELGHEPRVVLFGELAAYTNVQNLSVDFLVEFDAH